VGEHSNKIDPVHENTLRRELHAIGDQIDPGPGRLDAIIQSITSKRKRSYMGRHHIVKGKDNEL
jgi:hypothetical protein